MDKILAPIKQRIIEYIEFKGFEKIKFFESLGVAASNFRSSSLKSEAGGDVIAKILSSNNDLSADWLLMGKKPMLKEKSDVLKEPSSQYVGNEKNLIPLIPIEAMAGKGNGSVQILKKDIIDGYVIPEFTQRGVEYIIRVSGSSMYPKYSSGDLLGCRTVTDTSFFQWGKIYVLDTDQGPMVKRLFPVPDNNEMLECRSDNKEYPSFPISKTSIYKIAIVVGVLRLE